MFIPLDTNWPDHPKIIRVGLAGAGLHAMALCIAKRLDTDGVLDRALLYRVGGTDEMIDQLVEVGLFDLVSVGEVAIHNWLARNASQSEISEIRRAAGKAGNHARYGHPGDLANCRKCNHEDPGHSQIVANEPRKEAGKPLANSQASLEVEIEREIETAAFASPANSADDRKARLAAAAKIIGDRAAQRPGVNNPGAMSKAVARGVVADRHQDAFQLLAADPWLTAHDLAERLEPSSPVLDSRRYVGPPPVHEVLSQEPPRWDEGVEALAGIRSELGWDRKSGGDE